MGTNGNGKSPIHFPARQDVPIIGQPMTLKAWLVQLLVTCNCSPVPEPLLLIGQIGALSPPCPKCARRFVLQSVGPGPTGGFVMNVGAVVAEPGDTPPASSSEPA